MIYKPGFQSLSPVVHSTNMGLVRLPICKVGNCYTVYVADRYQRNFDEDTLPDLLKSKFAMMLSADGNAIPDDKLYAAQVYVNNQSREMDDVGWRVSDTYFCAIVTREFLESLKGG